MSNADNWENQDMQDNHLIRNMRLVVAEAREPIDVFLPIVERPPTNIIKRFIYRLNRSRRPHRRVELQ